MRNSISEILCRQSLTTFVSTLNNNRFLFLFMSNTLLQTNIVSPKQFIGCFYNFISNIYAEQGDGILVPRKGIPHKPISFYKLNISMLGVEIGENIHITLEGLSWRSYQQIFLNYLQCWLNYITPPPWLHYITLHYSTHNSIMANNHKVNPL